MSSARNTRYGPNLQTLYDQIQDLLIKIKPKLNDIQSDDDPHLVKELHHIASLAQTFSEQRLKASKKSHLADALDQEGVNLWNASGLFRQGSDGNCRPIVAALRLAGFRLMEAGLEAKSNIQALLHVLQIACKTGIMLSEVGNNETAASVLACAAKYEEALRNVDDPEGQHLHARARVTTVYFSSRMEAAWREKNDGLATFMADKITENDRQLALLSIRDREVLVDKFLEIGKSALRTCTQSGNPLAEGNKAHDALRWLRKAFQIIEPLDCSATPELLELKRSVLRSLARGYFLASSQDPENLVRAQAALDEVIETMDTSVEPASSEQQQLRWMKLAVVKRRKAGDTVILSTLESIIDNMTFSEGELTDILQELRTLSHHHNLVTAATRHCLRKAIACSANVASIEKLLIFSLFHCSKGDDHGKALKDLQDSFQEIYASDIEFSKAGTSVCLTLMWQYGDRHYHASRWAEAADWFMSGTHALFSSLGASSLSKCFRKAAVCQLQRKEYAQAAATIRRCPQNGAPTLYVAFLIAVHQGLEDDATRAVREMVAAPDFDRRMLLLACRLSHDADMKGLLLSVLIHLLDTLNSRENVDTATESMTLIRCIIRLTLKLLGEPGANVRSLVRTLLDYFKHAKTLVESLSHENATMVIRDISWLWRTAYNSAIDGCSNWEDLGQQISEAFDAARELLELYISRTVTEVEPSVYVYIANASFAATSGRVILARERPPQDNVATGKAAESLLADIKSCRARVSDLLLKVPVDSQPQLYSFLHVLRVFAVETAARVEDWGYVSTTIKEATCTDDQTLVTFEAFCDILWEKKACPVNVLYEALEGILRACLTNSHLSLEKFSRWLRSICTILLSQGTVASRSKAIQYVEQAGAVLEEHGNLVDDGNPLYPVDERLWLLSTAYNTGVECLHASLVDEAKRWFESATVLCRFVPDGKLRAEKISKAYTELLTRYAGRRTHSPA
ncbi:meiosis protein SPO22/ZIP4 like-domain-containing protein [Chiua virens]|nr:meiosis protein SPO22/ZIP4 like-domain-containing protein [Chiua virens]